MDARLDASWRMAEQNRSLTDTFARERSRLRSFIRRRVLDQADAEDILQDVFHELVEAGRIVRPVEQVGAWLYRVARNRITDLFRRKRTRGIEISPGTQGRPTEEPAEESIEDWLPSMEAGPEAVYTRRLLLEELDEALDELPEEQRSVFVAHELEGRSFKDLAAESGVGVNTLLSRKRYAVLHLRRRLQAIYDDFVEPWGY
jgi:RNA polymerase sigma factor (sigma-70 family)